MNERDARRRQAIAIAISAWLIAFLSNHGLVFGQFAHEPYPPASRFLVDEPDPVFDSLQADLPGADSLRPYPQPAGLQEWQPPQQDWFQPDDFDQALEFDYPPLEPPRNQTSEANNDSSVSIGAGGSIGAGQAPFSISAFSVPQRDFNLGDSLSMTGIRTSLALPLRMGESEIWLGQTTLDYLRLRSSVRLPDSGNPLPGELWNIGVGVMRFGQLDNGWRTGFILRVGSASDQPFGDVRDLTLLTVGFVSIPAGPRNSWNVGIFYSPTSQFQYPIPTVSYDWHPTDRFSMTIGVPFSMSYSPTDAVVYSLSYTPLTDINAEVRRTIEAQWDLFARYRTSNETYFLQDRANDDDRLFLFDQRLELGVSRLLTKGFHFELTAGYLFDRKLFQAEGYTDTRSDLLRIDSGVSYGLRLFWMR